MSVLARVPKGRHVPSIDMDPKQKRKALSEASQRATKIFKSQMSYFCTVLEETLGDIDFMLEAANVISQPKIVKDHIVYDLTNVGVMLIGYNDDQLTLAVRVPSESPITAEEWSRLALENVDINSNDLVWKTTDNGDGVHYTVIGNCPENGIYVFKLRDQLINAAYSTLRSRGLLPSTSDEDEDELYDEDVFQCV